MRNRLRYPTEGDQRKYKEWTKTIRERDQHVCIMCKSSDKLQVHHIETWQHSPELRFSVNNGVLLCKACHRETFKREQEYEFIFKNYITSVRYKTNDKLPSYDTYLQMKYGDKDGKEKDSTEV